MSPYKWSVGGERGRRVERVPPAASEREKNFGNQLRGTIGCGDNLSNWGKSGGVRLPLAEMA